MVFRRFRTQIIVRLLLLTASIFLLVHVVTHTQLYLTTAILSLVVIYQVYALIHFVEKTNRDLTRFLDVIRYEDYTQSFTSAGLGESYDELKRTFTTIVAELRKVRTEKEEQYRYLQTVIDHVGVGLLAFTPDGEINLINNALRRLLRLAPAQTVRRVQSLESISPSLPQALLSLKTGQKSLLKACIEDEWLQLTAHATEFKLRGQPFILVSIQNIQSELEEKEMEAWQNLIRVLTHEIMNSVTPISSLAATIQTLLEESFRRNEAGERIMEETVNDIRGAASTILRRSEGLLHFVDAYRNLTKLPAPNFTIFQVRDVFERVQSLLAGQVREHRIDFSVSVQPQTLELTADLEMVEQVLINLLINSTHAVRQVEHPRIRLSASLDGRGRPLIQVSDNGSGIVEEAIQKIFVPFFTTKSDGSGIGLSLARQIMRLHRGSITVQSKPFFETVFTLKF